MKRLRSGYTTGACAAAAAKAATLCLLTKDLQPRVEIPFPQGGRVTFAVHMAALAGPYTAVASIIKDAGDDPDVTNGAEIEALIRVIETGKDRIRILGGPGVGIVTKPGLPVQVGEPAINPMPKKMIKKAVEEAISESGCAIGQVLGIEVIISVPNGERLAEHTLNRRLGILGGISILGTTGIVRPISAEAWTATIKASMDVARAAGLSEVALSTGRTSEAVLEAELGLPEEAYVMMGDYLEFSLLEARAHGFSRLHLGCMWAKLVKAAMGIPQTHVRHGALEIKAMVSFLKDLGLKDSDKFYNANTAREIYWRLKEAGEKEIICLVCKRAKAFAEGVAGIPVSVYLIDSGEVAERA
ncbi:cobalt-precorrin-5B (C(1))-methyltransferase [Dissulfurimicrobium hydrothermale]|uniref:cobalt-precorrin-5B (C(1))-methyltransferase n=1 Tax=Dissulfurimicrobium hydrothermale TaxID=1750598 RepID=UPI001EDBF05E|nr:cobalt-precorrin-5B (C(1))-methyltransferase [Dissulfurimicrobium hydrothermale]UKL13065.1 cobalt-precorrin-5B (C(1))-methyltransferase [Dissulfurimicrobium hydrothermale]